jgi:drug/metabolite transporter (DMT)-like permease
MTDMARGILFALAGGVVYGLAPPFTRLAFVNGVPPIETAFWRVSVLVCIVGIIALAKRWRLSVPREARLPLGLMILSTASISIGYLGAVQFIPVALTVIVFFTFPVVILLLSPLIEGHRIPFAQIMIGIMAFTGLLIAIGPGSGGADWRGLALAGLASAGAAMQFFTGRAIAGRMDTLHFGLLTHLAIVPIVAVVIMLLGGEFRSLFDPAAITGTGYLALSLVAVSYGAGFFCQMFALKAAPASAVAPYFNIEPITSVAVAALILAEPPAGRELAGGALVLAALIAAGLARKPRNAQDLAPPRPQEMIE